MKADLHVHTCYSSDSAASLESIIKHCQQVGVSCLAITDHNTIVGAQMMRQMAPFPIVIGEEIRTSAGEIIGYFLTEEIPGGLSPEEVVTRIKDQGGLVCLPHPFDRFVRSPLSNSIRDKLLSQIDIIEVFNARSPFLQDSAKARAFAQTNRFLASAGSDAHTPGEVGRAYIDMPTFNGPEEFKMALSQGNIFGEKTSFWVHVLATFETLTKRLRNP